MHKVGVRRELGTVGNRRSVMGQSVFAGNSYFIEASQVVPVVRTRSANAGDVRDSGLSWPEDP